jgi:hypothetical protein
VPGGALGIFVMNGDNPVILGQKNIHLHRISIALPTQVNCRQRILGRIIGCPAMSNDLHGISMRYGS